VQTICIWSSWCHCRLIISCPSKIQNGLPFWCWLTEVVLEKRPLNGCSVVVEPVSLLQQLWAVCTVLLESHIHSSFSVAGPTAWNSLPVEFRHKFTYSLFCSHRKTFLFSKFYSQWHCVLFAVFFVSLSYCQATLNVGWRAPLAHDWLIDWLNWVMRHRRGYLSGSRCKWSGYGPADATATPSSPASLKSRLVKPIWFWFTQVVFEMGY